MTELDLLALDLGANSRTLRRAARRGAIRVHRVSPNKPTIDLAERRYLDAHWPLLAKLARALRTEKNVRLAVLFGSAARGDDRPGSDVDLLVDLADYGRRLPIARLELRLEEALGRPVQVVALRDAQASPALLSEAVADGRVIVDRDGGWLRLKRRKPRLRRLASAFEEQTHEQARRALAELAEQ